MSSLLIRFSLAQLAATLLITSAYAEDPQLEFFKISTRCSWCNNQAVSILSMTERNRRCHSWIFRPASSPVVMSRAC